jgi:hypothetical protein
MHDLPGPIDDVDDNELTEAIVAADDTGMVANEILITDAELHEGAIPPHEHEPLAQP